MNMWEKMAKIDRRIIYLMVGMAVIIPLIFPMNLPSYPSKYALKLYNEVDKIAPNNQPLLVSADYSPSMMPELHPMFMAIARHCFAKKIRLVVTTLDPNGAALVEDALQKINKEYPDIVYGRDYVLLGYKPGFFTVIMLMGESIIKAYPKDHFGTPLADLPMMEHVRNYADIAMVLTLCGSKAMDSWVIYAGTRYHAKVGYGNTAVASADYYPWLQSGQLVGQLNGLKGASEYEYLNEQNGYTKAPKTASKGMDAVAIVHLLIMAFIIIGNIGFFALRSKSKQQGGN